MIVRYKGKSDPLFFMHNKEYEVLAIECGLYRIVDETGEDYLFGPLNFEIVSGSEDEYIDEYADEE